jgi:protein TonB
MAGSFSASMFRDVLFESIPRDAKGTGVGFPVSVAVHALVVATVVALSGWAVQDPPDPNIPTIFQVSLPASAAPASRNSPRQPSRQTGQPSQPEFRPALLEASSLPAVVSVSSNNSKQAGGDAVGGAEGGGGTVSGGSGTDPSAGGRGEGPPIPVGGDVREPRLIQRVEPAYPDAARIARIQGLVVLEAIITTAGRVEDLRVLRSPSPLLSESALSAVGRWRYLPATLNERPVNVFLTVTVDFKLH